MSNVFDYKGEKIHIRFPLRKFRRYLDAVNAQSADSLSFEQMQKLFLLTIDDFRSGELSLDEMSEIAQTLWKQSIKNDSEEMKELKGVLLKATELNFYVRRIPDIKPEGKTFVWFMTDVMNYYEKNKKILS